MAAVEEDSVVVVVLEAAVEDLVAGISEAEVERASGGPASVVVRGTSIAEG